jgi:3-hydroxyisobutyrate dehydrogenase-like beta-hydroxyacid dehydrogenase
MTQRIGFMGLGIMGSAMAGNLLKAGFPITVYNRSRQKAERLAGQGATLAAHPRELAEKSDIVIAMVTGPEALDELLWGTDGAVEAFTADKTFINMSTVSPRYTRDLAQ